jgi:mannose-6-phosphate isomerase-like protein (cupin superfamily)
MLKSISVALLLAGASFGQFSIIPKNKPAEPATYVTPAEMAEELKTAPKPDAHLIDRPVRVIESGTHQIGVAVVKRTGEDVDALVHSQIDEIYYIIEGSGTMVTGGKLVNEKREEMSPTIGPGWRGSAITGGEARQVKAGDVVMIPANTPHMFTRLDGPVRYLVYRVDPADVLALK